MSFFNKLGLFGAVLICLPLAFSQIQKNQIEPITSALSAKNLNKAVQFSRAALKEYPTNAQLWALQGIALSGRTRHPAQVAGAAEDLFLLRVRVHLYSLSRRHHNESAETGSES